MKTVTMKRIMVKEYNVYGHSYAICQDNENNYWGFDLNELDEQGRLAKEYNGISGRRSDNMIDTMRMCYQSARTENEIDREKLKVNDIEEIKKLQAIIEDSYKEIA